MALTGLFDHTENTDKTDKTDKTDMKTSDTREMGQIEWGKFKE